MPPVPVPNGDFLLATLASLHQRLSALEVQQQSIISNLQGQPVVALGLQPGSDPAEYGIGLLNKAMGSTIALFGEDASGNVALKFFDGNGNLRIAVDVEGLHVYDTSGNEEARLGQLSSSPAIYGLGVAPATGSAPGTLQQVGGALSALNTTGLNSITTSQAVPSISITAEIGPSESALVSVGAQIAFVGPTGSFVEVKPFVDGSSNGWGGVQAFAAPSPSSFVSYIMGPSTGTALTPGTHTFTLYASLNGGVTSATISDISLTIQPL